ncbi:hypothetical protein MMPV_001238 [Pyropia vietnamensis]
MLSRLAAPWRAAAAAAAAAAAGAAVRGGSASAATRRAASATGHRAAASAPVRASAPTPRSATAGASAAPLAATATPEVASRAPAAAAPVRLAYTDVAAKTPPPASGAPLPPVVLLHGLLGAASTYRSLVTRPDFVPARRVVSVDLRNHGRSPHVAGRMGWDVLSGDVLRLMDELALPAAAVVGHSLDILRAIPLDEPTSRAAIDDRLAAAGVSCARTRAFVLTNLRAVPGSSSGGAPTYAWRVNLPALAAARRELSGWVWPPPAKATATTSPDAAATMYDGPTLFVRGTNSGYVDEARDGPAIARAFPRSTIVAVRGGHWLQADSPDDFCAVLNPFLEDAAAEAAPIATAAAGG